MCAVCVCVCVCCVCVQVYSELELLVTQSARLYAKQVRYQKTFIKTHC